MAKPAESDIQIIAHRGASGYAPENTVAAFLKAVKMGASSIEFDVQQAKDGTLVVIHDPDLKRVAGLSRTIQSMISSELIRVDVGSWFDKRFAGERVPNLDHLLTVLEEAAPGRLELQLEIKHGAKPYEGIEERVISALKAHPEWKDRIVISSFNHDSLYQVRSIAPNMRLGYLVGLTRQPKALSEAAELGCESVHLSSRQVNADWVDKVHKMDKKFLVYTINVRPQLDELKAMGVDGVFSNFPDILTRSEVGKGATRA